MANKLFILALFSMCLVGALSKCGVCDKRECQEPEGCKYGKGLGICGCCEQCLKGPGEACGGIWGHAGKCGDGLTCSNEWTGELVYDKQFPGECE